MPDDMPATSEKESSVKISIPSRLLKDVFAHWIFRYGVATGALVPLAKWAVNDLYTKVAVIEAKLDKLEKDDSEILRILTRSKVASAPKKVAAIPADTNGH